MKKNILTEQYTGHPLLPQITEVINAEKAGKIRLEGLTGSSAAMVLAHVFSKSQTTHVVIIPEKEDAAYFYNDLVALLGDDSIYFFPSTYKRSVQYEQTEPANIVLRTEVLNHLASGKRKGIIVTYPESVMEKVVSRKSLKKNTFNITKGEKLSLEFLEEVLHEYNFTRTDFVYEPGQYSIRGSIADIFSYSADLPYRIDFFGDEVETIRSFNTDDQLSMESHNQISVIPNIQDISIEQINDSFTDFLPPSSMIWIEDAEYIKEKINKKRGAAMYIG
jgi:transcription-repair coupling factor (superfamily II helicase)